MLSSSPSGLRNLCDTNRLVVLIPARNEIGCVEHVVRDVKASIRCEVIVIDDESHDGTGDAARRAGAKVLRLLLQQGAWGAIRTGLMYANKKGFDIAVTLDADGQHDPGSIQSVVTPIIQDRADVVIGSCPERGSSARKLAWAFFRRLTMLGVTDLTSGLRAYNRAAIEALSADDTSLLDYQDIGVLLYLKELGYVLMEVPVSMCERHNGHSRVFATWWSVMKYLFVTGVLCFSKLK